MLIDKIAIVIYYDK